MFSNFGAEIASSVLRLARGWTARGSNPDGERFSTPARPGVGPTQPPVQWVPVLVTGR